MKRFMSVLLLAAMLLFCASCGAQAASRRVHGAPVTVNETIANAETVGGTATPAPSADAQAAEATAAPTAEATAQAAEADVETPSTGEFPVLYLAAVLGLILLCSGGLMLLRRF